MVEESNILQKVMVAAGVNNKSSSGSEAEMLNMNIEEVAPTCSADMIVVPHVDLLTHVIR